MNQLTLVVILNLYNPIITLPCPSWDSQWGMPPKVTFRTGIPFEFPEITLYANIKHLCLLLTGRSVGDNNRPVVVEP